MSTVWNLNRILFTQHIIAMVGLALLVVGLFFPVVAWLSGLGAAWVAWREERNCSAIFIPYVGPILLTCWILLEHRSWWLIPAAWLLDPATVAFTYVLPRLVGEYWVTSSFTRIMTLNGVNGRAAAVLTLHSTGHYLLQKSWTLAGGETGMVSLGEVGRFSRNDSGYELVAKSGLRRRLVRDADHTFLVEEDLKTGPKCNDHSIGGWLLESTARS